MIIRGFGQGKKLTTALRLGIFSPHPKMGSPNWSSATNNLGGGGIDDSWNFGVYTEMEAKVKCRRGRLAQLVRARH